MTFSDEQVEHLSAPLNANNVSSRDQGRGLKLSYIEAWHAIAEANRIFGFGGWDRETVATNCTFDGKRKTQKGESPFACYTARVRITVHVGDRNVVREGTGAGSGFGRDAGEAHESAIKEAESDAMKRALMTFGNPFGLALYDKSRRNVSAGADAANPDDQRDEDGINPAERAALRVLMNIVRTVCTDEASVKAWINTNKGLLEQLRKGAKKELWDLLNTIAKNAPTDSDTITDGMAALRDFIGGLTTVDDVDAFLRGYEGGAAVGTASLWADLSPTEQDEVREYATTCKEQLADTEFAQMTGAAAA